MNEMPGLIDCSGPNVGGVSIIKSFITKGIDAVNLPSIFRSKSVIETMPTYFKEKEPAIISYTFTKTIASKVLNFSSTLLGLDYPSFTTVHVSVNEISQTIYINYMTM